MYPKLFSAAHISSAQSIFPEKINLDWCNSQWSDEEINLCKSHELGNFSESPTLINYPGKESLGVVSERDELKILDNFMKLNSNIKTMLSVGCGLGEKEIFLAKKYPDINFLCIDNAPYIESLNELMKELGLSNIIFKNYDLRNGSLGKFDLVFSMSVIYCIPDEALESYFSILDKSKNESGTIIVGCTATLSPVLRARLLVKNKLTSFGILKDPITTLKFKQTGWIRPTKFITKKIPSTLEIQDIFHTHHYHNGYPKFLNLISEKIFPLTNSGYLFILK